MAPGFSTWRRWVAPRSSNGSAFGSPGEQEVAPLAEDGVAVLAEHRERRMSDATRFLAAERPLHHRGQPLPEEGVRIGDGLVDRTGERPLERVAVVGPAYARPVGDRQVVCVRRSGGLVVRGDCPLGEARHAEFVGGGARLVEEPAAFGGREQEVAEVAARHGEEGSRVDAFA
jgi:hypothetical protein